MTSVRSVEELAKRQEGCLARWQLVAAKWPTGRCDRALRPLRRVHDGVYVTGHAPLTPLQRWWAATLTAPRTVLSHESAACFWGMASVDPTRVTVTRPGRTGPETSARLHVRYSATLPGNVRYRKRLKVTSPERTVIDVWPRLSGKAQDRLLREALRTKRTTAKRVLRVLDKHRGRRGAATLRARCELYVRLPLSRCRSDAEVEGLIVLDRAGVPLPAVNVKRAGEEADFSWPDRRLIVEIDGAAFHDPLEDARKTGVWTRAGWTVLRIPATDVYRHPERLVALARP